MGVDLIDPFAYKLYPSGNGYSIVPKARTRLIMSEKPNDGTVAIHIGEIEDAQYLAAEDYLPTLPNTVSFRIIFQSGCLFLSLSCLPALSLFGMIPKSEYLILIKQLCIAYFSLLWFKHQLAFLLC